MENEKKKGVNKYVWVLIILLILWGAIELFGKDEVVPNNIENNTNSTTTSEVINIDAGGNEPGWHLLMKGDPNAADTFLTVDYGESTFTGTLGRTWQENYDTEFQFRGSLLSSATSTINGQKDFIIYFKKEVCIDDIGFPHEYTAEVNIHSERQYKGCAILK